MRSTSAPGNVFSMPNRMPIVFIKFEVRGAKCEVRVRSARCDVRAKCEVAVRRLTAYPSSSARLAVGSKQRLTPPATSDSTPDSGLRTPALRTRLRTRTSHSALARTRTPHFGRRTFKANRLAPSGASTASRASSRRPRRAGCAECLCSAAVPKTTRSPPGRCRARRSPAPICSAGTDRGNSRPRGSRRKPGGFRK